MKSIVPVDYVGSGVLCTKIEVWIEDSYPDSLSLGWKLFSDSDELVDYGQIPPDYDNRPDISDMEACYEWVATNMYYPVTLILEESE